MFIEFLNNIEQHAGKGLMHRETVRQLLEAAERRDMAQVFMDVMFHAKFVVKTNEVMKRIGKGAEGFDTLSAQFSEGLERVTSLLKTLIKEEQEGVKLAIASTFLSMDQESFIRLLELLEDLSRVKNYEIDFQTIPLTGYPKTGRREKGEPLMESHLKNLVRSARLALVLLAVLLIFDGPFTILGWITAVVIAGLLIVIQFEGAAAGKKLTTG